jgi:hypothetical protein
MVHRRDMLSISYLIILDNHIRNSKTKIYKKNEKKYP